MGTYVHGLFATDDYRSGFLQQLDETVVATLAYNTAVDEALDAIAIGLESALDIDRLFAFARCPG